MRVASAFLALISLASCARSELSGLEPRDRWPELLEVVVPIDPGEVCAAGGEEALAGHDVDFDHELGEDEIESREVSCYPETPPIPGGATLVRVDEELPGERCPAGGQEINTGIDRDGNGLLGEDEIETSSVVCNGVPGDLDPMRCANGAIVEGTVSIATAGDLEQLDGITCIRGNLLIVGTDLTDLRGLENIREISGDFILSSNPRLGSLRGLDSLERVRGTFTILNNASLRTLQGLLSLADSGRRLSIIGNAALVDLRGLDGIHEASGTIEIAGNTALASLEGLRGLRRVFGDLIIQNDDALTDLAAINGLDRIDGSLVLTSNDNISRLALPMTRIDGRIDVFENAILTSVELERVLLIGGGVRVRSNPVLATFELPVAESLGSVEFQENPALAAVSIPNALYVAGQVRFFVNVALTSVDLSKLVTMGGELYFRGNAQLHSFDGFVSLRSIGGGLAAIENLALNNFSGLSELRTINGAMMVDGNRGLTGFEGLTVLSRIGGNLTIINNTMLPTSEAQGFASAVTVGGMVRISNNAPG